MGQPVKKINDLKQLLILVTEDQDGRAEYLYSRLEIGDVWWIPDEITGFAQKSKHPWVVVAGYKPNRPPVMACPRTTRPAKRSDELVTPANILPGLEKEGVILLAHRRQFTTDQFREFEYIGRLDDRWIRKIKEGIRQQIGSAR